MSKLSDKLKRRIVVAHTSEKYGKELIDAIESGQTLSGNGVPASSLGDNGNLYVNLINANVYSKANNIWVLISGGSGGLPTWGTIVGTLSDQTDLQDALDAITNIDWTGDYNNGTTYNVGQGVMYNGASFVMIDYIGAAGYTPALYPSNWRQVTDYVSPNDIGLGSVDNTSDLDKPISSATQDALDNKVEKSGDTMTGPLSVTSGTDSVTLSVYGLNSNVGLAIQTDSSSTDPTQDVFLRTGNASGSNYAGSIYLTGGDNVDGNPANIQLTSGRSSGVGSNGSVILDSKNIVFLNQNPTGGITASNHAIQNVGDPISPQDAATKNWVESISSINSVKYVSYSSIAPIPDGSFLKPYQTIAAALSSASNGDTIAILPGTYSEPTVVIPSTLSSIYFVGVSNGSTIITNGFSYISSSGSIDLTFEKITLNSFSIDVSAAANGLITIKQCLVSPSRIDTNLNVFYTISESTVFSGTINGGGNNFNEVILVASVQLAGGLNIFENCKLVAPIVAIGLGAVTVRTLDCELFGAAEIVTGNGNTTWETDLVTNHLGVSSNCIRILLADVPLDNITQSGALTGDVPAWDGSNWVPTDIVSVTLESTGTIVGLKTPSDVNIAVDDLTQTFTVSPVSGSFVCYAKGKKITVSGPMQINWTASDGMHFFYIDDNGALSTTTTFTDALITDYVFLSSIYWDAMLSKHIYFADERHGINMATMTHLYLHKTRGAAFDHGCNLINFVVDGGGSLDTHAQFNASSGVIWDEDIRISLPSQTDIPVYYRDGATQWKRKDANTFALIASGEEGYVGAGGRIAYNLYTGGSWSLAEVDNNKFMLCHIFASNDIEFPYIAILGQQQYNDKTSAKAGAAVEITALSGLPVAEFCPIGSVIFQTSNSYTNTPKAQIVSVNGGNYEDHRNELIRPGSLA